MVIIPFSSLSTVQLQQLATEKQSSATDNWEHFIWKFLVDWFSDAMAEMEIYTSGSTGPPRPVRHTKQAMLQSARMTCEALQLSTKDKALLCIPANKIGGMMMIVRCLYLKMDLYCMKPSVHPLANLHEGTHISFAAFTPMQVKEIMADKREWKKFQGMEKVLLGGENIRPELLEHLQHAANSTYSTFGMTETISHIALKKVSGAKPDLYYHTLPGIRVTSDKRNCLVIDAPAIGVHQLATNDMVELITENEFDWKGRLDHVINSGGVKLHPETIEQKLQSLIQSPFFVAGVADAHRGEKPVLVVQSDLLTEADTETIKAAIALLPKLERPKEIRIVNEFLKTDTGKVKRKDSLLLSSLNTTL